MCPGCRIIDQECVAMACLRVDDERVMCKATNLDEYYSVPMEKLTRLLLESVRRKAWYIIPRSKVLPLAKWPYEVYDL